MSEYIKKHYTIPLVPVPWKRAGKNGAIHYDMQKEEKLAFGLFLKQQQSPTPIFSKGPLLITVTFWVPIPKSKQKTIQEGDYHYTRPDASNFLKFIEDAMKDITVKDDCLFAGVIAWKRYSHTPRLEIDIEELPRN